MAGDTQRLIAAMFIAAGVIVYGVVTARVAAIATGVVGLIVCALTLRFFGTKDRPKR